MQKVLATLVFLLAGCTTLGMVTQLDEMTDEQFIQYEARVVRDVRAIAATAVGNGDITAVELLTITNILDGLSSGTIIAGGQTLSEFLKLDSYGALALTLAISELDARFEARGAYGEDGFLNDRAREVLSVVSAELKTLQPAAVDA